MESIKFIITIEQVRSFLNIRQVAHKQLAYCK